MIEHHPIFSRFQFSPRAEEYGWYINPLGVRIRADFMDMEAMHIPFKPTLLPDFDENYFEWIDILEAVYFAKDKFTMVELGAGFGPWLVNAATALRQISTIPYYLVAVEPEPTHFSWISEHFRDNGLDPQNHRLIRAAITDKSGSAWFHIGEPKEWYGQALSDAPGPNCMRRLLTDLNIKRLFRNGGSAKRIRNVNAVTLSTVLNKLDLIDLIDMDVQGAELAVISSSIDDIDAKAKRVHVGTHSHEIEDELRRIFHARGWTNINDYPLGGIAQTPYGPIDFQDGVQTWINPRLNPQA